MEAENGAIRVRQAEGPAAGQRPDVSIHDVVSPNVVVAVFAGSVTWDVATKKSWEREQICLKINPELWFSRFPYVLWW